MFGRSKAVPISDSGALVAKLLVLKDFSNDLDRKC